MYTTNNVTNTQQNTFKIVRAQYWPAYDKWTSNRKS